VIYPNADNDNDDNDESCLQVLVVTTKSCDIVAQQYAFNRLASVSAVSLHSDFRSARHAALRRRVSLKLHQLV